MRLIQPASDMRTRIREAKSSQKRDEVIRTEGPISRKSSVTVSGVSGKFIVIPLTRATPRPHIWSTIQAGGEMEIQFSPGWSER